MKNKKITILGGAFLALALLVGGFGFSAQAAAPDWNATGSYVISMEYAGPSYAHDMTLAQDSSGNLTGSGGYPAGGPHTYTWVLTSGTVSGSTIDFLANYTASPDAVVPQTVLHVVGTIALDGSMSGTWSDNYQGGSRSGDFVTTSGAAVALRTLTVSKDGTGSGIVTSAPAGISCGSDCSEAYNDDTSVTLTAVADLGSTFTGWSGACTSTGSCVVTMDAAKSVTATFTLDEELPTGDTPSNKDECKNSGWKTFTDPSFKNQGQCVSYVQANEHAGKK